MNNALTIVMGYRNREPERVRRCLESLADQTRKDFVVSFIDYGSTSAAAATIRAVVESFAFCQYIYTDTRGWPWSRSRALNVGVRMAETNWAMTTDVDMVFQEDFVDIVLGRQDGHTLIHCSPHWLPQNFEAWGDIDRLKDTFPYNPAWRGHQGGCQCFPLAAALQLQGFDEYYRVWGYEDRDFAERLGKAGVSERWADDATAFYHQWHPVSQHGPGDLAWALLGARMMHHFAVTNGQLVRNGPDWGQRQCREDRPVYGYVDPESCQPISSRQALTELDYDPADPESLWRVFERLVGTKSGEAAMVSRAAFPLRTARKDRCVNVANRVLNIMGISLSVGYPQNLLHPILSDYICEHSETIADVFFGCGPQGDGTVVVRR